MNKTEMHRRFLDSMHNTYQIKQNDYGDSFAQSIKEFGNVAALVRISDKWNRLKTLMQGTEQKVKDESVIDTCMDMANYLVMLSMELQLERDREYCKAFEDGLHQKNVEDSLSSDEEDFELPFTPDEEEEDEYVDYSIVGVAGDCDYLVPNNLIEKYNADKIGSMIAFRNAGWSQRKIADEFGIHQSQVSGILKQIERLDD